MRKKELALLALAALVALALSGGVSWLIDAAAQLAPAAPGAGP